MIHKYYKYMEAIMPQLHLSVDEKTAKLLASQATAKGESLSKYLAGLVKRQVSPSWPRDYLTEVIGSCADTPLIESPDPPPEEVEL